MEAVRVRVYLHVSQLRTNKFSYIKVDKSEQINFASIECSISFFCHAILCLIWLQIELTSGYRISLFLKAGPLKMFSSSNCNSGQVLFCFSVRCLYTC